MSRQLIFHREFWGTALFGVRNAIPGMDQSDFESLFSALAYLQSARMSELQEIPIYDEEQKLRRYPPHDYPFVSFRIRRSFTTRRYVFISRIEMAELEITVEEI